MCNVENPTSDFVSFSASDQRYFNVDPQCWNNVDPMLKCWLGLLFSYVYLTFVYKMKPTDRNGNRRFPKSWRLWAMKWSYITSVSNSRFQEHYQISLKLQQKIIQNRKCRRCSSFIIKSYKNSQSFIWITYHKFN